MPDNNPPTTERQIEITVSALSVVGWFLILILGFAGYEAYKGLMKKLEQIPALKTSIDSLNAKHEETTHQLNRIIERVCREDTVIVKGTGNGGCP